MAPAGRPRKPTAIRKLEGNPGKRAIPEEVEVPPVSADRDPPDWLTGERELKIWRETVAVLDDARIVKASDRETLALWCRAMQKAIDNSTASNISTARLLAVEFGMTPASRSKVVPTEAKEAGSVWDELDQMGA